MAAVTVLVPSHPKAQRVLREAPGKRVAPSVEATHAIRELAERQYGIVTRRQLLSIELGTGLIQDRVRSGRLLQIHRGVFAVGHRRIDRRGEWLAAVLACGPGAVLSHGSAADLWGLRGSHGRIEVTRTSGHRNLTASISTKLARCQRTTSLQRLAFRSPASSGRCWMSPVALTYGSWSDSWLPPIEADCCDGLSWRASSVWRGAERAPVDCGGRQRMSIRVLWRRSPLWRSTS